MQRTSCDGKPRVTCHTRAVGEPPGPRRFTLASERPSAGSASRVARKQWLKAVTFDAQGAFVLCGLFLISWRLVWSIQKVVHMVEVWLRMTPERNLFAAEETNGTSLHQTLALILNLSRVCQYSRQMKKFVLERSVPTTSPRERSGSMSSMDSPGFG